MKEEEDTDDEDDGSGGERPLLLSVRTSSIIMASRMAASARSTKACQAHQATRVATKRWR